MAPRRCIFVLVALAGCPQIPPPTPPTDPPPAVGGGLQGGARSIVEDDGEDAEGAAGAAVEPGAGPAPGAPGGGESLADTLAPRGRGPVTQRGGGCQDGARQASESWQVECNTCRCGDDGEVRCTALACGAPRGG